MPRKHSRIFYNKTWEGVKMPTALRLVCKKCNHVNTIPDFDDDFYCICGNKIVEHTANKTRISETGLHDEDLEPIDS